MKMDTESGSGVAEQHYDASYTKRLMAQRATITSRRTRFFLPYIEENHSVLDFGCGPGYLLDTLPGRTKFGVEISADSRAIAQELGLDVRPTLEQFKGHRFDRIVSSHALEHVVDPATKLSQMRELLEDDGQLILLLPINEWVDKIQRKWVPNDPNQHLFTWTPLLIGNLLTVCGFDPIVVETIHQFNPRQSVRLSKVRWAYCAAAFITSVYLRRRQLLVVARRSKNDESVTVSQQDE